MSVRPGNGRSVSELVDYVMAALLAGRDHELLLAALQTEFALSDTDAELALDRVQGGIVRALSLNPASKPAREDPLARLAFDAVWSTLPRRSRLSLRRRSAGPWAEWYRRARGK